MEMAEILLGEELLPTITGRELSDKLATVAQPFRDNLLNHSLDDTINAYKTWAEVTKTKPFRSSIRVLDFTVICINLLSVVTGTMYALEYYKTGTVPTYEHISVTFLPLLVVVVVQYCLNDSSIMGLLLKLLRLKKG